MIHRSKFRNSVREVTSSCALVAAGLALAVCIPHQLTAQGGYDSERRNSSTIVCSSNDGQQVHCDADTRGGVRLVRQISGSPCQQDSTWGYDSRGVWVDRGCRAEFDVSSGGSRNQMTRISAGTSIAVRTNETIDARRNDGRVFSGAVDRD